MAVREWLRPKDTPISFFHSKAGDGGLQICQFTKWIPFLKLRQQERLENFNHPAFKQHKEHLQELPLKAVKYPEINNESCKTNEEISDKTAKDLYKMLDGRGLKHAKEVRAIHSWKTDGNKLQRGASFISSVKVHGNLLSMQARAARGRNETTMCNAGCNSRASLSHIPQECSRTHGARIRRHDALVKLVNEKLRNLNFTTLTEKKIKTTAGLRKPDIIIVNSIESWVIDAQVVNGYDDPEDLHHLKKQYNNPDIIKWIKDKTGCQSVKFTTITYNWRGIMSKTSANDLIDLGITKKDLKISDWKESSRNFLNIQYNFFSRAC
ncbi:unnamed protein product [Darwinula stevensoni]|uniref:Reverse transcriptase n=1 Tax=Darwinula stevensoni TaxID=69355 RepID=A0A7R8XA97_9CRUS|nr:unnamed protein product [Darwinula stevensoni]CAG0890457.1 unnamed protein product [Darwinula stevensoni]